jgi:uncharacterized membrane protein YqjE
VTVSDGSSQQEGTRSLGDIVGDIASDLGTMVRSELELAKTEAKQEVSHAGKGAGLYGGAAISGWFALLFLSLCGMYLLGNAMELEWAALIVFAVWALIAGVAALLARKKMQEFNPKLETTQKTLKEDVQWAKNQK